MAQFILVNNVQRGSTGTVYAGEIVDDTQEDVAALQSAGGVLFPFGVNANVDAAAEAARNLRRRGGLAEDSTAGQGLITAAINALQGSTPPVALDTVQSALVTLVGGTVTESTLNYTANSRVIPIRNTAAGTPGDLSAGTITPGAPGSAVINSASGTDTSTVLVLVIG